MDWAQTIASVLKKENISIIASVPDVNIHQVTKLLDEDPFFQLISASREEEAIGIASGAYAVGRKSAVFMQSSGFGNSINAIASLNIPSRIPIPLFINLRGEHGEFNIAQVTMGRSTRPILDVLGLPHYTLENDHELEKKVAGAIKLCYSSHEPLAICFTPLLHGGKNA